MNSAFNQIHSVSAKYTQFQQNKLNWVHLAPRKTAPEWTQSRFFFTFVQDVHYFFGKSRGAMAPRTTRIHHFPIEFLAFPSPCWSFLPHTEAQLKLIFCEVARCHAHQDHQNPSFSYGIPCIFLTHTEAQLKLIFCEVAVPCPPGPPESVIFLPNSLHFPHPYWGST